MGLSSSQGRLLMLTSRLSDIELNEVLVSQRQSQLAMKSEQAAKEYQEATNNYKLTVKVQDTTGASQKSYTTEDISAYMLQQAGYLVSDKDGNIYLFDKNADGSYKNVYSAEDLDEPVTEKIYQDEETQEWKVKVKNSSIPRKILDGSELIKDSKTLQNMLINGTLSLYKCEEGMNKAFPFAEDTKLEYVLDTSDDAQAESKYEYEVARISRQDNMLDLELQQLETQHEAVLKEIESVKKVISNNVDRTFKIFSDG